jgi:hypothetical protein
VWELTTIENPEKEIKEQKPPLNLQVDKHDNDNNVRNSNKMIDEVDKTHVDIVNDNHSPSIPSSDKADELEGTEQKGSYLGPDFVNRKEKQPLVIR